MNPTLVSNKKYVGKYVALESFNSKKVGASGDNPTLVVNRAADKGIDAPVVFFVPVDNTSHIHYNSH